MSAAESAPNSQLRNVIPQVVEGVIYSITVQHDQPRDWENSGPLVIALIEITAQEHPLSGALVLAQITDLDTLEEIQIGQSIEPVSRKSGRQNNQGQTSYMVKFRPPLLQSKNSCE